MVQIREIIFLLIAVGSLIRSSKDFRDENEQNILIGGCWVGYILIRARSGHAETAGGPKDFTSGCTMEARNFQRDLAKYEGADAIILGVSVDTAQSHKDFCAKEGLNFKLLADPDAKVSTEYGSVMDYKGSKLAARNTFIINPNGEIAKVYTGVKPADHSKQVLKDLAELKKS
jgi:peroxiredoxin